MVRGHSFQSLPHFGAKLQLAYASWGGPLRSNLETSSSGSLIGRFSARRNRATPIYFKFLPFDTGRRFRPGPTSRWLGVFDAIGLRLRSVSPLNLTQFEFGKVLVGVLAGCVLWRGPSPFADAYRFGTTIRVHEWSHFRGVNIVKWWGHRRGRWRRCPR